MLPAFTYRGVDPGTTPSGSLYDEFVQTADGTSTSLGGGAVDREAAAQSWQSDSSPQELTGAVLRMVNLAGHDGGSFWAGIKAHSGTYGTSSVPTGGYLVQSPVYAMGGVAGSATNYWFPFSGWTPDPSTSYTLVVDHDIPFAGSGQRLSVVMEDGAEATHGGNQSYLSVTWVAGAGNDLAFKIYEASGGGGVSGLSDLIRFVPARSPINDPLTTAATNPVRDYGDAN